MPLHHFHLANKIHNFCWLVEQQNTKCNRKWHQQYNITQQWSHIQYAKFVYYTKLVSTVLVSDVKLPYQTMLAISTESVRPPGVSPPITMSLL